MCDVVQTNARTCECFFLWLKGRLPGSAHCPAAHSRAIHLPRNRSLREHLRPTAPDGITTPISVMMKSHSNSGRATLCGAVELVGSTKSRPTDKLLRVFAHGRLQDPSPSAYASLRRDKQSSPVCRKGKAKRAYDGLRLPSTPKNTRAWRITNRGEERQPRD